MTGLEPLSTGTSNPEGEPQEAQWILPTSFAQRRLWLLDRLEPGNATYNVQCTHRLVGPLNIAALRQSLDEIMRRHESLRTVFDMVDGEPVQVILPSQTVPLPITDLEGLPANERQAQALRLAGEESLRPFDLSNGPLLHTRLFRLGEGRSIFLVVMHHITTDGWSLGLFFRELAALYNAFSQGEPSPLPELPIQYADFSIWQREWLQDDVLEAQVSYWKQQLEHLPVLDLPADYPRPAMQTYRGARYHFSVSSDTRDRLKAVSQQEGATLFMILLAAFQIQLHRYSGQQEIAVGSPIAGRNQIDIEDLIGFFVNMLVLRSNLSGNPTFRELLRRVREVCLEAYDHQDLPFDRLVEEMHLPRDASRSPLFQVTFALQNAPRHKLQLSGLDARRLELDRHLIRFDLELDIRETTQGLRGRFTYNVDLFDAATIARMAGHFQTLLKAICAGPTLPIAELPLLTRAEERQILFGWNDTSTSYPRDRCVHQLFESQVAQTPEATAIEWGDQQLTYRQLNERANRLAHHLRTLGVGPDDLVGLCMERSPAMIVGMVAILKAGGAYVPLDPGYPPEQLAFMLEDTSAPVLLTEKRWSEAIPNRRAEVVCLDAEWEQIAGHSRANPPSKTTSTNLAYVIYTSGSTGRPKGVTVPHRAINRLVLNTDYVQLGPTNRIAQASTASFDAATFEMWGALLTGACLVGMPAEAVLSPPDLAGHLREKGITTLFLTTALFNQLAATVPEAFQELHDLLFGGEAVDSRWVREVLEKGPPRRLLHVYGPTEDTTYTTWHLVQAVPRNATTVPIGQSIANTRTYLLDPHMKPVPVGATGELYIGGDGLARGYLRRPGLTAERLRSHPFGDGQGGRLYRTGDLCRYRPDGNVEFLGRADHQVKLRGFRIELGEIEATLGQHPGLRNAVVVVREDVPTHKQLVAYAVPADGAPPSVGALRSFLQDRLPAYMVPSAFVLMEALPLSPAGKVDRRALPAPEAGSFRQSSAVTTPRDGLELRLVQIWEAVLGVQPVGRTDDFFQLGGHSLLAIHLFARIEQELGRKLPVATLFQALTVEQLAEVIRREGAGDWATLVPIQPQGSRPPFFCVHGFGGGVLGYTELARLLGPEQPFYGLQAKGLEGTEEPHVQIKKMAAHYIEVVRSVQPAGPYYLGGYCQGGVVAFEMARQLQSQGEQAALVAILEGYVPHRAIASPSLWRPAVLTGLARNLPYWFWDMIRRAGAGRRLWKRLQRLSARDEIWRSGAIEELVDDPDDVPEANRLIMRVQLKSLQTYRPDAYPGRVTLFRVKAMALLRAHDPLLGWGQLAAGGVEVQMIPGAHYNTLEKPHVEGLAAALRSCLDQAQE